MVTQEQFDVFLSHNSLDKPAVEHIAQRLVEEANLQPFYDSWHLVPGEYWQETIEKVLERCEAVAIFLGPTGIHPWHNEEIRASLDRAVRNHNDVRIIPVLLPGSDPKNLSLFLNQRTYVDFRTSLDDSKAFSLLVAGIIGKPPRFITAHSLIEQALHSLSLPDQPAPYPSLSSFTMQQARFFFGRENYCTHLLEHTQQSVFTAIIGASGSGKSSLVQAGWLPQLASSWHVLLLYPGSQPILSLIDQVMSLVPTEARLRMSDELEKQILQRSDGLARICSLLLLDHPNIDILLFVIDQFEEIFTQLIGTGEEKRQVQRIFIGNLIHAVQQTRGKIRVVITLRADFVQQCLEFADLRNLLETNQILLGPLDENALREAIVKPAQIVGAMLESGLVGRLVEDMRDQSTALPHLQVALSQLWQKRQGIWLTHAAYEEIGGISGAINQKADAVYARLNPAQQRLARMLFLRLVALGSGTGNTRRRMNRNELTFANVGVQEIDELILLFSEQNIRLITADVDTVEISHEALIDQWAMLRGWLEENRSALRIHRRLTENAYEWQEHHQDESYLYSGFRLLHALEWAKTYGDEMNALEQIFLNQSQQQVQARADAYEAARHLQERLVAEEPLARAGEAMFELERHPEKALLLALAAIRMESTINTPIVTRTLYAMLDNSRIRVILRGHTDRISSVAWSSKGNKVLTGSYDGTARIWDVTTGQVLKVLVGHTGEVTSVAWRSDGAYILTGSWDTTARVWDAEVGEVLQILVGHSNWVSSVAWSPDGLKVATGSQDYTARLWNVETGQTLQILAGHTEWVRSAEWSQDGKFILTGSYDATARIWDAETGKHLKTLKAHTQAVPCVAWSPDGKKALTASEDGTVRIWNALNWKTLRILRVHTSHTYVAIWSPDGSAICTGSEDAYVRIWDAETGLKLQTLGGHTGWVSSVAWSPDGEQVIGGSVDMTARIWDVEIGIAKLVLAHDSAVHSVAWSPDNTHIVTASSADWTARFWNIQEKAFKRNLQPAKAFALTWSPDGRRIAMGGWDGVIYIVDTETGLTEFTLTGHTDAVRALSWHSDGKLLLTGGRDGTARVWDIQTKSNIHIWSHTYWVECVSWSPDSKLAVTGDFEHAVRIWNGETGAEIRALSGHTTGLHGVAWKPNKHSIVTSSGDGTARVWDAATGEEQRILYTGEAHSVVWSPDCQFILTGIQDGTARIWDAATGIELRSLSHPGAIYDVDWSPDGNYIIVGCEDGNAYIWIVKRDMIIAEIVRRVCTLLTDDMIWDQIKDWRGHEAELAAVAQQLKLWDALTEQVE